PENIPGGSGVPTPPPAIDGAALYAAKCAGCHGPLATSSKKGRTAAQITAANMTQGLSAAEVQAVANALAVTTPPPPVACTSFTYSAWGTCSAAGSQTRTVLSSSPAGCTGGSPVLTQSCTPPALDGAALYAAKCAGCHGPLATSSKKGRTAAQITAANMTQGLSAAEVQAVANALAVSAPVACTYTTGAWGACQSNGTQTRTVSASPSGCTGTPPATSQACTYVPPVVACT